MPTKKSKTDTTPTATTTKSQSGRIFDVAPAGSLQPPSASARPVIVTNRAIMQDPMVVAIQDSTKDTAGPEPSEPLATKRVLSPLPDDTAASNGSIKLPIKQDTDADGLVDSVADSPAATNKSGARLLGLKRPPIDTVAVATAAFSGTGGGSSGQDRTTAVSEPAAPAEPTIAPRTADVSADNTASYNTSIDSLSAEADLTATNVDKAAARLEADARAQDEIDTLVDKKSYFLPINSIEKRRSKRIFVFGIILILVLAAVWIDIALDARFITIDGLQPVTHLFSS